MHVEKLKRICMFSPVHPAAVYECHGGLSSAVYFPLSGYICFLSLKAANILAESMQRHRKHMKSNIILQSNAKMNRTTCVFLFIFHSYDSC